jgi:hypothetical protein
MQFAEECMEEYMKGRKFGQGTGHGPGGMWLPGTEAPMMAEQEVAN